MVIKLKKKIIDEEERRANHNLKQKKKNRIHSYLKFNDLKRKVKLMSPDHTIISHIKNENFVHLFNNLIPRVQYLIYFFSNY